MRLEVSWRFACKTTSFAKNPRISQQTLQFAAVPGPPSRKITQARKIERMICVPVLVLCDISIDLSREAHVSSRTSFKRSCRCRNIVADVPGSPKTHRSVQTASTCSGTTVEPTATTAPPSLNSTVKLVQHTTRFASFPPAAQCLQRTVKNPSVSIKSFTRPPKPQKQGQARNPKTIRMKTVPE